jgi:hypothetical protein
MPEVMGTMARLRQTNKQRMILALAEDILNEYGLTDTAAELSKLRFQIGAQQSKLRADR